MTKHSLLNDPQVKEALQVLKDKGVKLYEIELWFDVASFQSKEEQK